MYIQHCLNNAKCCRVLEIHFNSTGFMHSPVPDLLFQNWQVSVVRGGFEDVGLD
jgi:hypothetical protein